MPPEPPIKRAIAFFDGQNLFYAVKQAFGYRWPNYDPLALARAVCGSHGWNLQQTCFYTGLPSSKDDPFWNHFWNAKLAVMGTRRHPHLLATPQIPQPDGQSPRRRLHGGAGGARERHRHPHRPRHRPHGPREDLRRGPHLQPGPRPVGSGRRSEEHRASRTGGSSWPASSRSAPQLPTRGINNTDWVQIDRTCYDACLDPNDYRPKSKR